MYARNVKSIEIGIELFHLIELDSVPTWCYASGKPVTDQDTINKIRDYVWING